MLSSRFNHVPVPHWLKNLDTRFNCPSSATSWLHKDQCSIIQHRVRLHFFKQCDGHATSPWYAYPLIIAFQETKFLSGISWKACSQSSLLPHFPYMSTGALPTKTSPSTHAFHCKCMNWPPQFKSWKPCTYADDTWNQLICQLSPFPSTHQKHYASLLLRIILCKRQAKRSRCFECTGESEMDVFKAYFREIEEARGEITVFDRARNSGRSRWRFGQKLMTCLQVYRS